MDREEIDDVICEILYRDGPDRHVDGHEVITDFIMAVIAGDGVGWKANYAAKMKTKFI